MPNRNKAKRNRRTNENIYKRWTTDGIGYFLALNLEDAKQYAEKINVDPSSVKEVKDNG
tara:strand:- start:322 stop:498 length:177 start_codon:yes stop_codon:yes gene_type:complete